MDDFEKYFKSLQSQKIDDITEHSHRPALKELLESIAGPKIKILHEPKREGKFGSPDFKVTQIESIIGYVENKKIEENLDKTIKSDQIKKYQSLSDNILITNYIDWIWIKEGKIQKREALCFLTDIENKRTRIDPSKVESVKALIKAFFSQAPKEINDAKKLAGALAIRAKLLKDFLLDELRNQEQEHTEGRLYQLYETFKNFVFQELTVDEFADAFAQNLVYGLFLAKLNADVHSINLYNAKKYIPSSFELIKELVNFLDELDKEEYTETRWIVEEVLTIMNNLDLRAIQDTLSFNKKRKDSEELTIKDPYVYFYEDFLAAYDKKLKKAKGVYYTPPPVVNFIVRAIDDILIDTFKIKEGLADRNKVTVLDFATGTGTFLLEVLLQIFEKLPKDSGRKDLIIKEHVLKNLFGFEYLIAPYTIAHLKLSQFLKDNGYNLQHKERLQIYLTNTLEPIPLQIKIPLLPALTEESKQAQAVKDKSILVITGNPPYSYVSKNNGSWIKGKIEDYRFVDGIRFKEQNPKGLQDDYVKFIRFAQDKMEAVEEGVVGIITNHRFLTNPTFRGMRQSLMTTFDQIYLIDLHGSTKPKEVAPDGGKDENVFDIEQGVSISLFVKKKGIQKKIMHTDFWGTRLDKYQRSLEDDIKKIQWTNVVPSEPFYLFTPQDNPLSKKYFSFKSIAEIYSLNSVGVVTSDDETLRDFNPTNLLQKVKSKYGKSDPRFVTPFSCSPFDSQVIYYDTKLVDRARERLMKHLAKENFGLVVSKQVKGNFKHIFITKGITAKNYLDNAGSFGAGNIFPIYLIDGNEKTENVKAIFKLSITALYGNVTIGEITGYIYAILHSQTYRNKYSEFLKMDFPRVPFPEDKKIFNRLAVYGNELVRVHLLQETELNYSFGEFIGKGNNVVEKPNYLIEKKVGRLYINKSQYFNNTPQAVYDFYIGGYQVIDKYLKDRKGMILGIDEVENLTLTIRALAFTIDQMKKIDKQSKDWI